MLGEGAEPDRRERIIPGEWEHPISEWFLNQSDGVGYTASYGLNACDLPTRFICWNPNPQCDGAWLWDIWGVGNRFRWGHVNGGPNGIRVLVERGEAQKPPPARPPRPCEDRIMGPLQARKRAPARCRACQRLIPDPPASRTAGDKCCLGQSPHPQHRLQCFLRAAWAD